MNRLHTWTMTIALTFTLIGCKGIQTTYTPINDDMQDQNSTLINEAEVIEHQAVSQDEESYMNYEVSDQDIDAMEKSQEDDGKCLEAGNLIENHSFECSDLADNQWNVFGSIPGWSADEAYNDAGLELQCGHVGSLSGSDGSCHLELDAHPRNGFSQSDVRIYQDVAVEEGLCYELSYDYSPRMSNKASSNAMHIFWDDEELASHQSSIVGWQNYTHQISSSKAGARLAFAANIDDDTLGAQLDNIKLSEAACPEEENSDEQNQSISDGQELDQQPELVCEDSTWVFVWGDIEGNTHKWNNFGYSYVRMLNDHGQITTQDLIKWDRHDVFYGSEDDKKIAFYTRVITGYDGFSISAKHCYPEGKRENPAFEIVLGDVFKKRIVLKRDKHFSYTKIRGDDVEKGHGLVVMGAKKHASEIHFVAGNWSPKKFKNKKFQNYKGVFSGHVLGHADDDGRIFGKWGAKDQNKQIFHGHIHMQDKSKSNVRGKYKPHKKKKHIGIAGGRVYQTGDVEAKRKIRLRYFNRNGDKHGTLFGWIVGKKEKTASKDDI